MRIAVWHNLPSGGGKRALHDHVRGLTERGHDVEVWCPDSADPDFLPLRNLVPEHVLPIRRRRTALGPRGRIRMARWRYRSVIQDIRALYEHCRDCGEEINRGRFDVLLANSSRFLNVPPVGMFVDIPRVLYLQEPCRQLHEAYPKPIWPARALAEGFWRSPKMLGMFVEDFLTIFGYRQMAKAELRGARAYDTILANSYFSRESIMRAYGLDARVCYVGVDTRKFCRRDGTRERWVLGLGAMAPRKGMERSIMALASIPAGKRPRLVWIGDVAFGPYKDAMIKLADRSGVALDPRVRVSDEELISALNTASALLYTPVLEPFGLAPLEANACGLPVVAIAEGGVRETVRSGVNGVLVAHNDPDELGRAILGYLDNPARLEAEGRAAREYVEANWRVDVAVDRIEHELHRAVNNTGRRPRDVRPAGITPE